MDNGELVLVDMNATQYFRSNQTGTPIWQLLARDNNLEQIRPAIGAEFDITPEKAWQSVITFTNELLNTHLLSSAR